MNRKEKNKEPEVWKDIQEYESLYQVSNFGNLKEWSTRKENVNYGNRHKNFSLSVSKVIDQFDLNNLYLKSWNSAIEAKKEGFSSSGISRSCNGIQKSHKGFIWKFNQNENDS